MFSRHNDLDHIATSNPERERERERERRERSAHALGGQRVILAPNKVSDAKREAEENGVRVRLEAKSRLAVLDGC